MESPLQLDPSVVSDNDSKYGALSNFEIEKKIGKGQFSVVYRARCKVDSSIVALKKVQVRNMFKLKWTHAHTDVYVCL